MKKLSAMGSSKYEFCPNQFDVDIANKTKKLHEKRQYIYDLIDSIIKEDPSRIDETFSIILNVMKELKHNYNL